MRGEWVGHDGDRMHEEHLRVGHAASSIGVSSWISHRCRSEAGSPNAHERQPHTGRPRWRRPVACRRLCPLRLAFLAAADPAAQHENGQEHRDVPDPEDEVLRDRLCGGGGPVGDRVKDAGAE
jgi:hypothetical protein